MDGSGVVQWVAIALSFVAVAVILRYAREPRCGVCSRRHPRADAVPPTPELGLAGVEVPEQTERAAISWRAE